MPDTQTSPAPPAAAPRPHRWPIVLLRVLTTFVLLQTLTQAALAGGFVTGDVSLLGLHSANGILLGLTATVLVLAAGLLVRPGRGPWWPVVMSVGLWWLIAMQMGFGFARQIGLHIPLGVAVTALAACFTWWSYTYRIPRGTA